MCFGEGWDRSGPRLRKACKDSIPCYAEVVSPALTTSRLGLQRNRAPFPQGSKSSAMLSRAVQNLTISPVENLTVRRGDEPQVVATSFARTWGVESPFRTTQARSWQAASRSSALSEPRRGESKAPHTRSANPCFFAPDDGIVAWWHGSTFFHAPPTRSTSAIPAIWRGESACIARDVGGRVHGSAASCCPRVLRRVFDLTRCPGS